MEMIGRGPDAFLCVLVYPWDLKVVSESQGS